MWIAHAGYMSFYGRRRCTVEGFDSRAAGMLISANTLWGHFRVGDLTGQFVPDPMRQRGESLKTTQDHSAQ
jgi:hypothetical protein